MDNQSSASESVRYQIVEEKNLCVILFKASFSFKCKATVAGFIEKLKSSKCEIYILNFKEIERIDSSMHRSLIQLQAIIRSEFGARLRLCELRPNIKNDLIDQGIIKPIEYFPSFREALLGERKKIK